jgi:NitT/TauT family transport system substrate-binding protein
MAQAQTTGFTEKELFLALFGTYPAGQGGAPARLAVLFGFTPTSLGLIAKATAFLYSIKSIDIPALPEDAVLPQLTAEVLKSRGLTAPVGEIKAAPEAAVK